LEGEPHVSWVRPATVESTGGSRLFEEPAVDATRVDAPPLESLEDMREWLYGEEDATAD